MTILADSHRIITLNLSGCETLRKAGSIVSVGERAGTCVVRRNKRVVLIEGGFLKKRLSGTLPLLTVLLMGLSACDSSVFNNPHGLLGGLFSSGGTKSERGSGTTGTSSGSSRSSSTESFSSSSPPATTSKDSSFGSTLSPPTFSHVVPLSEGDGIYLQWRKVENASDYLVYDGNRLIKDVPQTHTRIMGLLPCTGYAFRIYSSNGKRVSRKGLLVRVHTRGCLTSP